MASTSGNQAFGMSLGSCYVKAPDLVARHIAGETIIVPVRAKVAELDCLFTLNEVASLAWDLLDGQATLGQIAEQIVERFEVSIEEASHDLGELLGALAAEGLVRPVPGEPSSDGGSPPRPQDTKGDKFRGEGSRENMEPHHSEG